MESKKKTTEAWGIAGLVLAILSVLLIFAPYFALPLAITAVVFSGIQKKHKSTGIAIAALVIGIIGIIINLFMLIFLVGIFTFLGAFGSGIAADSSVAVVDSSDEQSPVDKAVQTNKIKSGTLLVDRVTVTAANLDKIRVTIENTGDVAFAPKFDVFAIGTTGETVCEGSPFFGSGSVAAGKQVTKEIQILACIFNQDGDYTVKVDMLDSDFNKLDSGEKTVTVSYWGSFGLG
jgi:hypothetical protein